MQYGFTSKSYGKGDERAVTVFKVLQFCARRAALSAARPSGVPFAAACRSSQPFLSPALAPLRTCSSPGAAEALVQFSLLCHSQPLKIDSPLPPLRSLPQPKNFRPANLQQAHDLPFSAQSFQALKQHFSEFPVQGVRVVNGILNTSPLLCFHVPRACAAALTRFLPGWRTDRAQEELDAAARGGEVDVWAQTADEKEKQGAGAAGGDGGGKRQRGPPGPSDATSGIGSAAGRLTAEQIRSLLKAEEARTLIHFPSSLGRVHEPVLLVSSPGIASQRPLTHTSCIASSSAPQAARAASPQLQQLAADRTRLPITPFREEIISAVANNQVVIIAGETGCGKTTQVPQYLLESAWAAGRPARIICTQPRRISAVTVSERIAAERGENIGGRVVRFTQPRVPVFTVPPPDTPRLYPIASPKSHPATLLLLPHRRATASAWSPARARTPPCSSAPTACSCAASPSPRAAPPRASTA